MLLIKKLLKLTIINLIKNSITLLDQTLDNHGCHLLQILVSLIFRKLKTLNYSSASLQHLIIFKIRLFSVII